MPSLMMIQASSSSAALASRLNLVTKNNPVSAAAAAAAAGIIRNPARICSRFPHNIAKIVIVAPRRVRLQCTAESDGGGDHDELIRGCSSGTIRSPLRKAWEVAADFYSLHKWVPSVQECYEIERNVRFCRSFPAGPSGASTWVKEELLMIDGDQHTLRYRIIDGNMGLEDYTATMKFSASNQGDDDLSDSCCFLEWSFTMSPRSSKSKEEQEKYLAYGIRSLEKRAQSLLP